MKKNNWSKIGVALSGALALSVASQAKKPDAYFQIKDVKITEKIEAELPKQVAEQLRTGPDSPSYPNFPNVLPKSEDLGEVFVDQIINIGEKVWKIVEKGQPVMNVNLISANALPKGVQGWDSLGEWQNPVSRHYTVEYTNGFNVSVVKFSYRIVTTTGGSYKGVGKYIAQISTLPAEVNVAWGYKFNAETLVPNVVNVGTDAAPIAGAETSVHWEIKTPLKHSKVTQTYFIRGDGQYLNLNR